jgi:hypothetical protein
VERLCRKHGLRTREYKRSGELVQEPSVSVEPLVDAVTQLSFIDEL